MTVEEKKAYLMQYRVNEREIERLQEEIAKWQSRAEKVTAGWNAVPGGGAGEGFPACVEKIAELQAELGADLERSVELHRTVSRAISAVEDSRARLLLRLRYIDGLTWERVAEKMGCDERSARRIHKKSNWYGKCP